jgi:hypothetical protein
VAQVQTDLRRRILRAFVGRGWCRWAKQSHSRPSLRHPSAHRRTTCGRC